MINGVLLLIILFGGVSNLSYAQTASEIETTKEKMDAYAEKTKAKWKYNPFRQTDIEKRLIGWQDPYANITRFWTGAQLNAYQLYPNLQTEDITIYLSPTIATEFSVVAFDTERLKFRLGVGVLVELNLAAYGTKPFPKYGKNFLFTDYVQVEVYLDFIIDDSWKIRWIPVRHKCSHASGDIFGDPAFHDPDRSAYADLGYEEMIFSVYYQWSWFTFYGGLGFGYTNFKTTNYATLFTAFWGTDMRVPIWGEMNFITGLYVSADYDIINTITRIDSHPLYQLDDSFKKWYPTISIGVGLEIDRYTVGFKYIRMRSRQVTSYRVIEERIGFEASIFY